MITLQYTGREWAYQPEVKEDFKEDDIVQFFDEVGNRITAQVTVVCEDMFEAVEFNAGTGFSTYDVDKESPGLVVLKYSPQKH